MNKQNANEHAELIWNDLFSINNIGKTKEEQIKMITSRLADLYAQGKQVGRNQIINHIQGELDRLK